ncbi:MAG: sensor histidine kinase [Lachnospiraceae bacterium]
MRDLIRNLPFKFRIFFGCLLVALIPILFSGVFMVRIFDASLQRQSELELNSQLDDLHERLNQLFLSCESASEKLTSGNNAYHVLIDHSAVDEQKDLYLLLYQAVQETYSYAQFSVYDVGGMLRFTTDSGVSVSDSLPTHWGVLRKASQNQGLAYYRTDPYIEPDSDTLLRAAWPVENTRGARSGYIVMNFTSDSFNRLFSSHYTDQDVMVLLDEYSEVVYCSRPEYSETEVSQIMDQALSDHENGRFLYHASQNPDYGYTILLQKNAQISDPAIRTMNTTSLMITVLVLWLCLMISLALSRSISQPISQLDQAMKKIQQGDLSIRIYTNRKDELGRLSESFNRMTGELSEYLETTVQKQKDLNETNLKLYQTQLNPHFLYNTLDTIKWSAKINQNPEIPILAENLAQILRYSISSSPFIQLYEELKNIFSYIEIQKIRFTGRFLYEVEIPYQLEDCLVPKMILQPLVENAILHGLDGCEHGYICIYALQKDGFEMAEKEILQISVTDNGCGMNQEMLEWVNRADAQKHDGHLGLYNIIQILKLRYGQEYGLHAVLNPEGGTTVTISLPIERR